MKNLLVVSLTVFGICASLNAAQCEGQTQAGVRCKREAAENSKFCIGHADQAKTDKMEAPKVAKPEVKAPVEAKSETKTSAEAKLKDDGTCWAVTEKGERCKHKKDGESDYCKQHAADKKPAKPVDQCRAMNWNGTRCERAPQSDCFYCSQHAKLGAPKATPKE